MGHSLLAGRSLARAQAMQLIFQSDMLATSVSSLLERGEYQIEGDTLDPFGEYLADGTDYERTKIDTIIESVLDNWDIRRIGNVDKAFLRIGTFELLDVADIDIEITISEMVRLAKLFGQEASGTFVNGVLGNITRSYHGKTVDEAFEEAQLVLRDKHMEKLTGAKDSSDE